MKRIALTHEIDIQKPTITRDQLGIESLCYETQFVAWAHIDFGVGNEVVVAGHVSAQANAIITIRNTETARSISSTWRIKHRGHAYPINENPRISDDRRFLQFEIRGAM